LNQPTHSILLVSLSCVGDAVMTTPVLEALHLAYPEARIDIVSDRRSDSIYTHCPYRGTVFIKDKKLFMRGALALLKQVRKQEYDLIVDLRTDGLAYLCKGKKRLTKLHKQPYGEHAVEELMGVIRSVYGEHEIPAPRMWLTAKENDYADTILSGLPGKRWLAFAPGNLNDKKVWSAGNYAALANALVDVIDGVILDGSPREKEATTAVGKKLNVPFVDLAGQTSLLQAAAVLGRASLFVGADSGLGHIAAAVGTPTLTFFSVDSPERVLPRGNQAMFITSPYVYTRSIQLDDVVAMARHFFQARLVSTQE
jgi:heptosyltransferase-3